MHTKKCERWDKIRYRPDGKNEPGTFIINIIAGYQYYSATDLILEDGDKVMFKVEKKEQNGIKLQVAYLEIYEPGGECIYRNDDIFIGAFGAN